MQGYFKLNQIRKERISNKFCSLKIKNFTTVAI